MLIEMINLIFLFSKTESPNPQCLKIPCYVNTHPRKTHAVLNFFLHKGAEYKYPVIFHLPLP